MSDANAMKLARDGQLAYGKPDRVRQRVLACIAAGHVGGGVIEYSSGVRRCCNCLLFYDGPSLRENRGLNDDE